MFSLTYGVTQGLIATRLSSHAILDGAQAAYLLNLFVGHCATQGFIACCFVHAVHDRAQAAYLLNLLLGLVMQFMTGHRQPTC